MRLAKLTLCGFKSFADRTEFRFDTSVTGIVGPNGCGKSNVVDAIKWVLGERSAKSLRSKEMQDVIFAGSAGRGATGFASVILTFDNPVVERAAPDLTADTATTSEPDSESPLAAGDAAAPDIEALGADARSPLIQNGQARTRALPIDTETVDVERRLYRDGASKYLINASRVRLRDIRELFMDTGIGADAYSIIEQGKVDAMLLSAPTDRRTIFEEAAGVAKFKARRIESQRKLERTETNLAVVREQLASTERRLRIIRTQAEKAKRYKTLAAEFTALRMALAFDRYHELRQRLDGLTSRMAALQTDRENAENILRSVESAHQEALLSQQEAQQLARDLDTEQMRFEHEAQAAQQRRAMREQSALEAKQRAEQEEKRANALRAQRTAQECELADALDAQKEREAACASADADAQHALETKAGVETALAEARSQQRQRLHTASDIDRQLQQRSARLHTLTERVETLSRERKALQERIETIESTVARASEETQTARAAGASAQCDVDDQQTALTHAENALRTLSTQQREHAATLAALESKQAGLTSRRDTLDELLAAREGLAAGARAVLALRDERDTAEVNPFARVVAPLADLIETAPEHARAVETALGERISAIVVDGPIDAICQSAQTTVNTSCLFVSLPLARNETTGDVSSGAATATLGAAPRLVNFVRCADARVRALLVDLLGDTRLASSLESATLLAAGPYAGKRLRFVTAAGDALDAAGVVRVAGKTNEAGAGAGVLARKSERAALAVEITSIERDLEIAKAELARFDVRTSALEARRAQASQALSTAERTLASALATVERLEADLERLGSEGARAQEERTATLQRAQQAGAEKAEITQKTEQLTRLRDEQRALAEQAGGAVEEAETRVAQVVEAAADARARARSLADALATHERDVQRLQQSVESAERSIAAHEERIANERARADADAQAAQDAAEQIERASADASRVASRAAALAADLEQTAQCVAALIERLALSRQNKDAIERDWNSLEISRREVEIKRETLEEQTADDIDLDLTCEYSEYRELITSGVTPIDHDETADQIANLRKDIRKLGNVNLDAIEEAQTLEERNVDLEQQVADLDAASATLSELITRLSDVSRERFKETFTAIQQRFGGKDGMFRLLFGGGSAEVRLMPDEETGESDWLESGVEIIARPPGKQPRSINQLSGGERTMTSIALLLSIFESRPSPFCILDEVDAALDDANVDRFVGVIDRLIEKSNLILITHNKRSMQAANVLYGVTMPQRGVSRRVEVRLDEVGEDGAIAPSSAQETQETINTTIEVKHSDRAPAMV